MITKLIKTFSKRSMNTPMEEIIPFSFFGTISILSTNIPQETFYKKLINEVKVPPLKIVAPRRYSLAHLPLIISSTIACR